MRFNLLSSNNLDARYRTKKLVDRLYLNSSMGNGTMLDPWETALVVEVLERALKGDHGRQI